MNKDFQISTTLSGMSDLITIQIKTIITNTYSYIGPS